MRAELWTALRLEAWRRLRSISMFAILFGCAGGSENGPEQAGASGSVVHTMNPASTAGGGRASAAAAPPPIEAEGLGPITGGRSARAGATALSGSGGTSGEGSASVAAGTGSTPADPGGSAAPLPAAGGGGESGAAGTSTAGDAGAAAMSYPMLSADQIGQPIQIARGFRLAESPVWDPCTGTLMFADVQGASGKGAIHTLSADGKASLFMSNTGNTNGFTYDIDGSLILAQMNGHVARRDKSGTVQTLDPSGSRLHTPDDVVVRSDGTIYFSDGDFCPIGNLLGYASTLPVFMIKPDSSSMTMVGTVSGPNGIELSPDEKTLYVAGFGDGTISAFDVSADGSATKRARPLISGLANPDSLCLDLAGNLYVGVGAGLQVLRPDGAKVKLIPIDAPAGECTTKGVTNCTFGGSDGRTLYITTWTTIWKVDDMPIPGLDWQVGMQRAACM